MLRICAIKSNPAILPGAFGIGFIRSDHTRQKQESIPACEQIFLPAERKHTFSGSNAMDQVMIPHGRPPCVPWRAFLNAAAIHRKLQTVVVILLEGSPKRITHQTSRRLSSYFLVIFYYKPKQDSFQSFPKIMEKEKHFAKRELKLIFVSVIIKPILLLEKVPQEQ